jgi:hypothetical protein
MDYSINPTTGHDAAVGLTDEGYCRVPDRAAALPSIQKLSAYTKTHARTRIGALEI